MARGGIHVGDQRDGEFQQRPARQSRCAFTKVQPATVGGTGGEGLLLPGRSSRSPFVRGRVYCVYERCVLELVSWSSAMTSAGSGEESKEGKNKAVRRRITVRVSYAPLLLFLRLPVHLRSASEIDVIFIEGRLDTSPTRASQFTRRYPGKGSAVVR